MSWHKLDIVAALNYNVLQYQLYTLLYINCNFILVKHFDAKIIPISMNLRTRKRMLIHICTCTYTHKLHVQFTIYMYMTFDTPEWLKNDTWFFSFIILITNTLVYTIIIMYYKIFKIVIWLLCACLCTILIQLIIQKKITGKMIKW